MSEQVFLDPKKVKPLKAISLPQNKKHFLIVEDEGKKKMFLIDGEFEHKGNEIFQNNSMGFYEYIWNEDEKKWSEANSDHWEYLELHENKLENILYSTQSIQGGGIDFSSKTELIEQGREKIPGFVANELFDFSSLLHYTFEEWFILNDEDLPIRIFLDPERLILHDDVEDAVKMSAELDTSENLDFSFFFRNEWNSPNADYSLKKYESYYPYTFIRGGSKEVVNEDGVLVCPKLEYMVYGEWKDQQS